MSLPLRARRVLVTFTAVGATAVSALLAPAMADAAPAPQPATATAAAAAMTSATITGHGYGHGRGMGQYGAYGYAVNYHWTYQRILSRYYGGTHLARPAAAKGSNRINVRLTAFNGKNVRVTSKSSWFKVGNKYRFEAGQYAVLKYLSDGKIQVYRGSSCTSGATLVGTVTTGVVRSAAAPGNDVRKMLAVCNGATRKVYRGYLTLLSKDGTWGGRRLVNTVGVDDYLRGVVPRESPASWADAGKGWGMQAIRAQTIAARGYALTDTVHSENHSQTCDTTACQVYGGAGTNDTRIEDSRTDNAVATTTGLVLLNSAGKMVASEFSASTGGFTAGGTFPAVSDQGDAAASNNPYHNWTSKVSTASLQSRYGSVIGTLTSMKVTLRDGHGAGGGRAVWVRLYGTKGHTDPISGESFRSQLGLKSTWFFLPA
ncbi:SpoIID/LytB domain-containing protein [Nakamurella lactea]|uniref:SpoIID/LytB domain-containing protein n=1 Tax=Nakamurella lactea TaxID=459515 RepID=UPI000403F059|nr:SpoIID/LytB domain-containing protein [Nakamurella lactea]